MTYALNGFRTIDSCHFCLCTFFVFCPLACPIFIEVEKKNECQFKHFRSINWDLVLVTAFIHQKVCFFLFVSDLIFIFSYLSIWSRQKVWIKGLNEPDAWYGQQAADKKRNLFHIVHSAHLYAIIFWTGVQHSTLKNETKQNQNNSKVMYCSRVLFVPFQCYCWISDE